MKKIVWISLMIACLPFGLMAQNANDDLYFIPKKKTEKATKVVVEKKSTPTTVYASPASTVVVKDVNGNVRDVDEYNRRYTSRDNTFMVENDTLYIEEKPYDERGEWVNGFEGSQSDYEYAMRIVRFRNPRFAIPVSSPLYWEVVYGLPSWEWNIFDDGFYAYVFPTYSNSLWWNWRYSWGFSWGSSWYCGNYWHNPHWGYTPWHYSHWHHSHWYPTYSPHPHYGWVGGGGYWGNRYGANGSSALNPRIHADRYKNVYQRNYASASSSNRLTSNSDRRNSRDRYVNGTTQSTNRAGRTVRNSSGRVVTAKEGTGSSSVRPQRQVTRPRNGETTTQKSNGNSRGNGVYTRPAEGKGSSYNRQSSTRSTVRNVNTSTQQKNGAAERGAYRSSSSERSNLESRSSYENSRSSSSSSSSRSSYSSGSSHSSRSSSAGGASRSSGGSSRSGGRR